LLNSLRAAASLARLWGERGRQTEARELARTRLWLDLRAASSRVVCVRFARDSSLTGIVYYEPELHRLDAELRLRLDTPDEQRAEASFRRALETAGQQEAKSWEHETPSHE
jgi:hypothetical protein